MNRRKFLQMIGIGASTPVLAKMATVEKSAVAGEIEYYEEDGRKIDVEMARSDIGICTRSGTLVGTVFFYNEDML